MKFQEAVAKVRQTSQIDRILPQTQAKPVVKGYRSAATTTPYDKPYSIIRSDTITINRNNISRIAEAMPFSYIAQGRFSDKDISEATSTRKWSGQWSEDAMSKASVKERNYALAATTPVLGQYAPTFGWPDDWGWYWEYVDAYLFVPEAAFATKLKTRQIWKPGYEFDSPSKELTKKVEKEWKRLKLEVPLKEGCKNGFIWGNEYLASQDNSNAVFAEGTPADYAQGASFNNITGAPRPLVKFTPATKFYGLMNTDPRTFRIQVHPQRWDDIRHTVLVEKYIQRRWAGPLAPTYQIGSDTELDFHPEQIFHLAFNKITGGIYGYSTFREVLFTLKGFLIMLQFLPGIVEKRADPLLTVTVGGEQTIAGVKQWVTPTNEDFLVAKERIAARMPGEDIFIDAMTKIEEVYKGRGSAERVEEYITSYKERVMLGLGIPMSVASMAGGSEIKWGTLNFNLMEDEIREYQMVVEDLVNEWVIPKILLNLGTEGQEVTFAFNEITSEDWRADVAPLVQLYASGIIPQEYVWRRLGIPPSHMKGTFNPLPVAGTPGQANKVASQPRSQGGLALSPKTKQVAKPNENKTFHVKLNDDESFDITERQE